MSDDEIAAEAKKLADGYLAQLAGRGGASLTPPPPRAARRNHFVVSLTLFGGAAVLCLLWPSRPSGLDANGAPLGVAIALAALGSAASGWTVFALATLWLAFLAPPAYSLAIEMEDLGWFAAVIFAWATIPACAYCVRRFRGPLIGRLRLDCPASSCPLFLRRRRKNPSINVNVPSSSEIGQPSRSRSSSA